MYQHGRCSAGDCTLDGDKTIEDSKMTMVLENKYQFGFLELQADLKQRG